ncbi:MAG TPA: tetratricopeptide repeat protein, partial [Elainellaceae cyanobacterium]
LLPCYCLGCSIPSSQGAHTVAILIGLILLAIALLLMAIAGVWGLVLAFGEHPIWGFAYLLVPFAAFIFMIAKWSRRAVRKSFFLSFTGLAFWLSGFLVIFLSSNSNFAFLNLAADSLLVAPSKATAEQAEASSATVSNAPSDMPSDGALTPPSMMDNTPSTAISPRSAIGSAAELSPQAEHRTDLGGNLDEAPTPNSDDYHQIMMTGYEAFQQDDYETALDYFRHALSLRPSDTYATKAIDNTIGILQSMEAGGSAPVDVSNTN